MALSNTERQARYRQRLKDAAQGVTPEMVVRATQIIHRSVGEKDGVSLSWEDFIASCNKGRARLWTGMVPDDVGPDAYDFLKGEEHELVEKVAAITNAIMKPPPDAARGGALHPSGKAGMKAGHLKS
jgi:hypothetical protein